MHHKNKHTGDYDFEKLIANHKPLESFVHEGKSSKLTIDFARPKAVKALNTALLKSHYGIDFWEFPDANLCPPIPGRVEYIHLVNDLLQSFDLKGNLKILDIGTGATCIYPLLGYKEYNWDFIATEVDKASLKNSKLIIEQNKLESHVEFRFQQDSKFILEGIIKSSDKISAAICNPPFFKNKAEANASNTKKLEGLGKPVSKADRNFSGTEKELIYDGGEKAFLHNYLYQSSLFKNNIFWFTSLVSKKELVKSMKLSLNKLGVEEFKVIPMKLGNKISRVVAWTFLNIEAQESWKIKNKPKLKS